jgi:hypothetical protein
MKRFACRRASTVLAAALLMIAALEVPAWAAPPRNDAISSATPLGAPPHMFVEDTRQATASTADGRCVLGRSVWFRVRRVTTRTIRLSTLGSDYDTMLAVFRGPRTNRTLIRCVDDTFEDSFAEATQVRFVAGNTYWVAVSACCGRSGVDGGRMVLNTFLPAAARVSATVDSVETGAISGRLLLTGTVHCNTPSEFEVDLAASQRVAGGANVARGEGFVSGTCGPEEDSTWTASLDSDSGWAFQTGTVAVDLSGFGDDGFSFVGIAPQSDNFTVTENPNARSSTSRS